jgi:hypothetical protein
MAGGPSNRTMFLKSLNRGFLIFSLYVITAYCWAIGYPPLSEVSDQQRALSHSKFWEYPSLHAQWDDAQTLQGRVVPRIETVSRLVSESKADLKG